LNPFLHFFKTIEFFHRKIVQINIFPRGIKNSAKEKDQAYFAKKNWYFFGQNFINFLNQFLHFFKKIELFHKKTVRINIFPGRIKKLAQKTKIPDGGRALCPPKFLTEILLKYFYDASAICYQTFEKTNFLFKK
jgi:hypothetical protein